MDVCRICCMQVKNFALSVLLSQGLIDCPVCWIYSLNDFHVKLTLRMHSRCLGASLDKDALIDRPGVTILSTRLSRRVARKKENVRL